MFTLSIYVPEKHSYILLWNNQHNDTVMKYRKLFTMILWNDICYEYTITILYFYEMRIIIDL